MFHWSSLIIEEVVCTSGMGAGNGAFFVGYLEACRAVNSTVVLMNEHYGPASLLASHITRLSWAL